MELEGKTSVKMTRFRSRKSVETKKASSTFHNEASGGSEMHGNDTSRTKCEHDEAEMSGQV